MNRIEGENKHKNSKMPPVLKKWMKFKFLTSKVESITEKKVIPKLSLLPLLKSPKLVSLNNKLNLRAKSYSYEEELSCIAMFAISNQSPEIIEELIELKVDINIKVDHFKSKTILAIIVQYPYYHELFVKLIEAGAKPYCNSTLGDENFSSNVLYRSVTYDEFLNIAYLIENKYCSLQLALQSCYNQNKLHMLQYFLETCGKEELKLFKDYVTVNKMSRQIEVLDIIQYLS